MTKSHTYNNFSGYTLYIYSIVKGAFKMFYGGGGGAQTKNSN